MKIVNKDTTELTDVEIQQICDCFKDVFKKKSKSADEFKNQFLNTCLGYSFHTILKNEENEVVGQYAVIPFDYIYRGENRLFCIGVDFMIRKDYRNDFKNVLNICRESIKYAKMNGISCIFAFPNDLSYQLNRRILKMKDVGKLNTYILPYKIGDAKPSLKIMNIFSKLFSRIMLVFSKFDCRTQFIEPLIHRNREVFNKTRYNWFNPEEYRLYEDTEVCSVWKIADFEGVRAAFLIDVYPINAKNFNKVVNKMFNEEKNKVGLFLYVGNLPFVPTSMLKIPLKIAPKNFNFVAQLLDKKIVDEDIVFNIKNWDINLSSYDLI